MLRKGNQTLNNFNGTLLWKDLPILDFCIERGKVLKWEMHPENEDYYPIEFTYNATVYGLQDFIDCRIVPITRQNLQRVLKDLGLKEYSWDGIIRANYGLCTDDCYWFRQDGSNLKYDDIKIRD